MKLVRRKGEKEMPRVPRAVKEEIRRLQTKTAWDQEVRKGKEEAALERSRRIVAKGNAELQAKREADAREADAEAKAAEKAARKKKELPLLLEKMSSEGVNERFVDQYDLCPDPDCRTLVFEAFARCPRCRQWMSD